MSSFMCITANLPATRCLAERLPLYLDTYRPDIVLYDAGVDVHEDDGLGR